VSRQEIVQGYLDGQLSRRVFIRRLVATGVTAASALSYATLLEADPAAAAVEDFYLLMGDNSFQSPVRLAQGQGVEWHNSGPSAHNARDITGLALFSIGLLAQHDAAASDPLPGAGTYDYKCDGTGHPRMAGVFTVPIVTTPTNAALGTAFAIRWAHAPAPAGLVFDVQRRNPGQTTFSNWRMGVRAASANIRPPQKGVYAFRARVRKSPGNRMTKWSPVKGIRVT
jgi:plastocyanin